MSYLIQYKYNDWTKSDGHIVEVYMTNPGISLTLIVAGSDILSKSGTNVMSINCCETKQIFS